MLFNGYNIFQTFLFLKMSDTMFESITENMCRGWYTIQYTMNWKLKDPYMVGTRNQSIKFFKLNPEALPLPYMRSCDCEILMMQI